MNIKKLPAFSLLALKLSLLGLVSASLCVNADEIDANLEPNLNTNLVVVTGSRIEESIDEVPTSVTVILREEIEAQLAVSSELQSLLETLVPGMAPATGSSSNSTHTLRGRSPLVMIDGVPQSTPLRNGALGIRTIDPETIERIEVIKGATSIYGNGAAGGIINYITKQAASDSRLAGQVSFSNRFSEVKYADSNSYRVNASLNGTLDKWSYALSTTYEDIGLQRDANSAILGKQYGLSESESKNIFAKVGYEIDLSKYAQLTYNYYQAQQNANLIDVVGSVNSGQPTYAIRPPEGVEILGAPQGPRGNHNLMFKYVDQAIFDKTQLTFDYYAQSIENVFFFSPTLANQQDGYEGGQSMIKSEKSGLRLVLNSQPILGNFDSQFVYGIDALNDITSQPILDGRVWVPEMDMNNLAGFVQSKFIFDANWVLKAGIRHEKIDLSVDDYDTLRLCRNPTLCSVPIAVTGGELNYTATTYNLGLRYNKHAAFSPFISYSQGADISDLGRLLRTATVPDITLIRTEASIIDHYELGVVSEWERFKWEFATYQSTSDLGTTNSYDPTTGVYMPVRAPQKIWGAELSVDYKLTQDLKLAASYTWVEGKNEDSDEYLGGKQIAPPKLAAQLNWNATENMSLSLRYLRVFDRKRFEQDENGDWQGDQGPVDSYQLFHLAGSYHWNETEFFFGVENLLNLDYYPAKSQEYTYNAYNTKGMGRTVNVGVKYSF
ncbi:TonB-dependent receptor [Aliikangiella sp. IMCC44632]